MRAPIILAFSLCLGLASACGSSNTPCEPVNFETHLGQQASTPDGVEVMLHHSNRTCSIVGSNSYHLIRVTGDHMTMASHATQRWLPAHGDHDHAVTEPSLHLTLVTAWMPAHGHGPTREPQIDDSHAGTFTVEYQMPGTWELTVEFIAADITTATQSVTFTLDVLE